MNSWRKRDGSIENVMTKKIVFMECQCAVVEFYVVRSVSISHFMAHDDSICIQFQHRVLQFQYIFHDQLIPQHIFTQNSRLRLSGTAK